MSASPPTKSSDGTLNNTNEAFTEQSPKISAEANADSLEVSAELSAVSLEESTPEPQLTPFAWPDSVPSKQPMGMTGTFSKNEADMVPGDRMESQCAFYFFPFNDQVECYESPAIVDFLDFTHGSELVPDLSSAKPPRDYPNLLEGFVPAARHTEVKLHRRVRWEFSKSAIGLPSGSAGVSLPAIQWSEPDVARLRHIVTHEEARSGNPPYYMWGQFYHDDTPKGCRRCQGNLHHKDYKKRKLLECSSNCARKHADEFLSANRAPSQRGVVGEVKELIDDPWTQMTIGVIYWNPDNMKTDLRKRTNRHWAKITKYGCWGHSGRLEGMYRNWSCCGRATWSHGCTNYFDHDVETNLSDEWYLFASPETKPKSFRNAIALACALGTTVRGHKELIRLTAIDYYSGEVLIDNLVWPEVELLDTHFRESGITWERLTKANKVNKAIKGRDAARNTLFEFVGDKTILIVHAAQEELISLRMIHRLIIDVKDLASRSVFMNVNPKHIGLQTLVEKFLKRDFQGRTWMSTFEKALVCRDLCRHMAEMRPIPTVWIPEFTGLEDVTKNEDLCKIWLDSETAIRTMLQVPDPKKRPRYEDNSDCESKHRDSGLDVSASLNRWRVFTPSPFSVVLKDLENKSIDKDGWPIYMRPDR